MITDDCDYGEMDYGDMILDCTRLYQIVFRDSAFFARLAAAFARRQQAAEAFFDAGDERRRAERAAD